MRRVLGAFGTAAVIGGLWMASANGQTTTTTSTTSPSTTLPIPTSCADCTIPSTSSTIIFDPLSAFQQPQTSTPSPVPPAVEDPPLRTAEPPTTTYIHGDPLPTPRTSEPPTARVAFTG